MTLRLGLLAAIALVNAYLLGVLVVFQRVDYPLLGVVARADFPAHYAAFTSKIPLPVVLPEFVALVSVVPLFWIRPARLTAWPVWLGLAAGIGYMAITFGWHLRVHAVLATGDNSPPVIDALLASNGARTWLQAAKCVLLAWMVARSSAVA